ncbi:MBL fold metallo-hydrolase [Acinetobacter radioresistens]|uniref:MBL fold metallo-hydrolase n=1 Tax=Acinetobacter radioresistens TaxID=40216 RepID=UPI00321593C6
MKIFKTLISLVSFTVLSSTGMASTATPTEQVPGYYHQQWGKYTVTALLDGTNYMSPSLFKTLNNSQVKHIQQILKKYHNDQQQGVQTSVNAFLINTGTALVLVDSGAASCFGPHLGSVSSNLVKAGYRLEDVNVVLLTHLHPDHVCGLTKEGQKVFPNAKVYAHEREVNYWLGQTPVNLSKEQLENYQSTRNKIQDAIAPYQQDKKFITFKEGQSIAGLQVMDTRGHTPGHHSFVLEQNKDKIVFIGDTVHSHSVQFEAPRTAIEYDIQPDEAVKTRLKLFSKIADEGSWVAAPHLPFPGIGHISKVANEQYLWIPVYFNNVLQK